jgi:hypothetical protein
MSYPLAVLYGAVSNVPASSAADDSVSLFELLVPLCGWVVLTVGFCLRFRRQPRNMSA